MIEASDVDILHLGAKPARHEEGGHAKNTTLSLGDSGRAGKGLLSPPARPALEPALDRGRLSGSRLYFWALVDSRVLREAYVRSFFT